MKKSFNSFLFSICLLVILPGCKKIEQTLVPYDQYGVDANTRLLKIVYASAYFANPAVLLKVNSQVVSGLVNARMPFPGSGYNTVGNANHPLYLNVPQGNDTVSVVIPKVGTKIDSVVLYTTVISIPENAPRTLFIADTLVNSTTNKTASVLVKNEINEVPSGYCRYRFVNLIPNTPVDIYVNNVKILSNIAYKQATDTFSLAIGRNAPGVIDTTNVPVPAWAIRPAGALPNAAMLGAGYTSANTMLNKRVYTVFTMGYMGGATTRIPYISFTLDNNQNP